MKYFISLMLLLLALHSYGQSPFNIYPALPSQEQIQFKKNYHSSTLVELSGLAIAVAGGTILNDPSGKQTFMMFGTSIALGGLIYSLMSSSHNMMPAQRYNNKRTELVTDRYGMGIKMKF